MARERRYVLRPVLEEHLRVKIKAAYAGVAELADALDSGSSESNFMWVQVPSPAPKHSNPNILPLGETFGFVILINGDTLSALYFIPFISY